MYLAWHFRSTVVGLFSAQNAVQRLEGGIQGVPSATVSHQLALQVLSTQPLLAFEYSERALCNLNLPNVQAVPARELCALPPPLKWSRFPLLEAHLLIFESQCL